MVNISAVNKILLFQKLQATLSGHSSLLACSAHASRMLMQRLRFHSSPIRMVDLNSRSISSNTLREGFKSMTTSSTMYMESRSTESLDKFREREEQREREYEQKKSAEEAQSEEEAKRTKINAIRTQILEAALPHVSTLGWSRNVIVKGAEEAGFPSVVHGMFPEGGYALVSYFYGKCNDETVRRLQEETKNGSLAVADPLEFLVRAVRTRLDMVIPYKPQWSQALALMAMPQNAATSLAQLLTLVDDICYYAGDRSVDFGWYTRRIGLATIMKMTELFMLQDSSADHANTWEFLKNRMDEAVQIQLMLSQTEGMTQNFTRSFNSAFVTARNILGIDYMRR
ncbi:ubiquinone biosynthesis protein COQ9, mitochondrial isoform X2 [Eurosta solidaginis]|uniref:ubiquinone biosynthesis protein COQ9, mitochondrial isoform X2 n=1 Tax=Eurosta solidaginis TaxID=178769 RepID=UPI003530A47F